MATWTDEELDRISSADELQLTSLRDGRGHRPEHIEYFDNLAFDEILCYGNLDTTARLMVQLAARIACQTLDEHGRCSAPRSPMGPSRSEM